MEKIEEIITCINKIRPYMQRDGGDVEFVKFEDGFVFVRMHGACMDCLSLDETLQFGLEALLLEEVEGVRGVKLVKDDDTLD